MYILLGIPGRRSCTLAACYPLHLTVICTYRKGKAPRNNENTEDFTMKMHLIDFPEDNISIESFYDRLRPCYDGIMQFGDRVLVAQMNWNGMLEGAVYGFVEDPEEGWSPIECRLELLKISDETYTDAGHAIEWCIKNAH